MESWGIVIVSIVGTVGTVIGVTLTNRHTYKLADAQRKSEAKASRRERLVTASMEYMKVIDRLEDRDDQRLTGPSSIESLRRFLDLREFELSVLADAGVALAARKLSLQYAVNMPLPEVNPAIQEYKDALTTALRAAILDA